MAPADVVDDLRVTDRQFAAIVALPLPFTPGAPPMLLQGWKVDPARMPAVAADSSKPALALIHESQGEFAKALESGELPVLDRVRLLLRLGRTDEARRVLQESKNSLTGNSVYPSALLSRACRPLEDAQAWDTLGAFLTLLTAECGTPAWKEVVWAEELDVAWHLDRLQPLLDGAEPLRRAFFLDRLGEAEKRDKVMAGLLENASPARIAEYVWFLPESQAVRTAAYAAWMRGDVGLEDRRALLVPLLRLKNGQEFEAILLGWLQDGGDAAPLAELLWSRWAFHRTSGELRDQLLRTLHQKHPTEPRYRLLLARQIMLEEPLEAAGLFESVASLPLVAAADPGVKWQPFDRTYLSVDAATDLPFVALSGLGNLNRQDRIRVVLDAQPGWKDLPPVDQVRYLAAGRMDFEGIKLLLGADYSKPENDGLGAWLKSWLESCVRDRVLPGEVAGSVAAGFDRVVAGSAGKAVFQIGSETVEILRILSEQDVDPQIIKGSVERLRATMEGRGKDWQKPVGNQIRGMVKGLPRLNALLPLVDAPEEGDANNFSAGFDARSWLVGFSSPEIRRIGPPEASFMRSREAPFGWRPGKPPIHELDRWSVGFEGLFMFVGREMTPDKQAILRTLMKSFPVGDPRRLPAEILVAADLLDPADEALKKESNDALAAVLAGQREPRGTEGFRLAMLAAKRAGEKELRAVLEELLRQPPAVREEFLVSLQQPQMQMPDARLRELGRQVLGSEPRPAPPARSAEIDQAEVKQLLAMNDKNTPEARALARKILDEAASRALDLSVSMPTHHAVTVLVNAGEMDAWVKQTREKLVQSGIREVDVLRRLRRIDTRFTADGASQGSIYAREILRLNPTDVGISRDLLPIAAAEGDRELLLQCMRNLGAQALDMASQPVLANFGPADASLVLSLACPAEPGPRPPGSKGASALHRFLLAADAALATEFRTRMMARGGIPSEARREIAEQLLDAGRPGEAVDVFARNFVISPDYPGFPHVFPPKAGRAEPSHVSNWDVSIFRDDVGFLTQNKLLEPVLMRMDELGNVNKIARATFILATLPDLTGIESRVMPLIAHLDKTQRILVIRGWGELFEKQAGASELVVRLLSQMPQGEEPVTPYQLQDLIDRAARQVGGQGLIASTWARLLKATDEQDPKKKEQVLRSVRSLLATMMESADDATWQDYWTYRSADAAPLELLKEGPYSRPPAGFIDPARLRQVLPRAFQEVQGKMHAAQARAWVLVALATGEEALVKRVRELLPDNLTDVIELCDLALGDTRNVSPLHGAVTEENGETLVWWNLVSLPTTLGRKEGPDISRVPMPALDGKFQISISAGARPDRMSIVQRLDAAPAGGHVRLKLGPDQHHVALLAIDPASGAVRWMAPVDARAESGRALEDADLLGRGFHRQAWDGPGGLPAWKVRLSDQQVIDLREGEWDGLSPVVVSAWTSGEGKLALRCLDAGGGEVASLDLIPWQTPEPVWQFEAIRTPEKNRLPAQTVRLVISAASHGHASGPRDFAISNVRFSFGTPAPLPEGFERLVRVYGEPRQIALSPDGTRLGIGLANGKVAMVNVATRKAVVVPLATAAGVGEESAITGVMWRDAGLMVLTSSGQLQRFDEAGGKMEQVFSIRKGAGRMPYSDVQLSPDGKWLAWRASSTRLSLASVDGNVRRDLALNGNEGFQFVADGLRLYGYSGKGRVLKAADFAAGEPQPEENAPKLQEEEEHPSWKGRLSPGGLVPERKAQRVAIPATTDTMAIAKDGTLYYVDRSGNVTKVTP